MCVCPAGGMVVKGKRQKERRMKRRAALLASRAGGGAVGRCVPFCKTHACHHTHQDTRVPRLCWWRSVWRPPPCFPSLLSHESGSNKNGRKRQRGGVGKTTRPPTFNHNLINSGTHPYPKESKTDQTETDEQTDKIACTHACVPTGKTPSPLHAPASPHCTPARPPLKACACRGSGGCG